MDEPENLLSVRRQMRKVTRWDSLHTKRPEVLTADGHRWKTWLLGWGRGRGGPLDGNGVFFWGDEKVLELNGGDGGTRL